MNTNARYHIPFLLDNAGTNLMLIDLIAKHPEYFRDGVSIASVYGCFPPAIWNGGRTIKGNFIQPQIAYIIKQFNDRGVPFRFTFTNPNITEAHMSDDFCNMLLNIADNGLNEVIVNTDVIESYIRKTHPNYKLTSSTCKQIREYDPLIAELEKDYHLVVLDYNWNNRMDDLAKIPEKYRDRLEVLVCPYCYPNCKRRGEHYRWLGELQLRQGRPVSFMDLGSAFNAEEEPDMDLNCDAPKLNFLETRQFSTHVTPETLYGQYVPMGFEHFKIEGRTMALPNVVESFVYYLAKPEYKDMVRLKLLLGR